MQDVSKLALSEKAEISAYIARDNLAIVNEKVKKAVPKDSFYTRHGKRYLDFIIALICFILALPLNLVMLVATLLDVGRPVFFKQQRIGKDEKIFTIYKFRNMTNATDANGELLPPERRVTRWGRFARKTSLDELLNFVSVLNGSMSIIGPRPLVDYYVSRLNDRHKAIYAVRPGLECPSLQKADHPIQWQERLDNYVWYVENCSFLLDVKLCLRVITMAFDHRETDRRAKAGYGGLMGYNPDGSIIYSKAVPDQYVEEYCRNHGYSCLQEALDARNADT